MALTPFYSFLAYKYNANSIFLSLWPWTLYVFVGALRERKVWAVARLRGSMMGFALDSKYFALTFAATCLDRGAGERRAAGAISAPLRLIFPSRWRWRCSRRIFTGSPTSGAPPIRYLARVSGRTLGETAVFAALAVLGALLQQSVAVGLVGGGGAAEAGMARARGGCCSILRLGAGRR